MVIELIEQSTLSNALLTIPSELEGLVDESYIVDTLAQPRAEELIRYHGNPVLQPIPEHSWESKYVLNAGAIKLGRKVYMLYRAYGDDEISRIGLAISEDGYYFNERLEKPIFEPGHETENKGCEDPRLTLLGNQIYMTYTAYDGIVAQIAIASISVNDFLKFDWESWQRLGLFLPGCNNKDAFIFPEQFDSKVVMVHRIEPHIWITFSSEISCPWPSGCHKILAKPSAGSKWDSEKIGAGAQPLKTKYGWLLITHGVDRSKVYRLGVMLLDLFNPTILIYRSPNFILEPSTRWELGNNGEYWVPNVVFTCGAIPLENGKDLLEANDEIIVYYGGADTVMNIATARVGALIPEEIRDRQYINQTINS
ncbi:MAG: glycosidase [Chloroflexi bacterium]|jgi:predicted GH43/DUF377 family glycosyl hydrolase|nr:glycosidase [Chloroflexota bacterium]